MTKVSSPPPRPAGLRVPRVAWIVLGVALAAMMIWFLGLAGFLLVAAGCSLASAVFLGYSSLIALAGEDDLSLTEALTLVAPSTEEEQKRSVLRALKDLEYERAVGKITLADYTELTARYREEARRLLQLVATTQSEQLAQAERRLAERLGTATGSEPPAASAAATASDTPPTPAQDRRVASRERARRARCPSCRERVARNARFCPACGVDLRSAPPEIAAAPSPGDRDP